MKKLFILLLLLVTACSDNSTEPEEPLDARSFLPMNIGNYWIYEYTELDINGQPIGDILIDSTLITGSKYFNDEQYYEFVTFRNNKPIDTTYWNANNKEIYSVANQNNTNIPGFPETKFKMMELYIGDWFIFDYVDDSLLVEWNNTNHLVKGEFNFHGYRNYGDDTVYIHDKQYIAFSTKVVADARYTLRDSTAAVYLHNQPTYIYYHENTGIIETRKSPHYITEKGNPGKKIWFNGWRRQMIRYYLH